MKPNRHFPKVTHYLILLILITVGAFSILYLNFNRLYQTIATIILSVSYLFWGIIHHLKEKDLDAEIVMEYLLVALFGTVLLISVIQQT